MRISSLCSDPSLTELLLTPNTHKLLEVHKNLSEPDTSFSDSSISDDITGSSDNEANDETVNIFGNGRKRSARDPACVKGGRCGCGVHHSSSSQKKKVSWHTMTIIIRPMLLPPKIQWRIEFARGTDQWHNEQLGCYCHRLTNIQNSTHKPQFLEEE